MISNTSNFTNINEIKLNYTLNLSCSPTQRKTYILGHRKIKLKNIVIGQGVEQALMKK